MAGDDRDPGRWCSARRWSRVVDRRADRHRRGAPAWLYTRIRPVLDLMQTIPTFVYLIPTLVLFGLGMVPGLISTVIFALPAPIRLTYLGISSVPMPLLEAGEAFGATRCQLLWKVELPLRPADHHGRHHPVHHAVAVDGGDRGAGRRRRPRQAGGARAQHRQYRAWASRPASPSSSSPSCSTASASSAGAAAGGGHEHDAGRRASSMSTSSSASAPQGRARAARPGRRAATRSSPRPAACSARRHRPSPSSAARSAC